MNAQLRDTHIPAGLYLHESEATYHGDREGVLSCSAMKQLLRSPAHYQAWATAPMDSGQTESQRFGKAFHAAILEPERFAADYMVLPEDAPRRPSISQREAVKPSPASVEAIRYWDAIERAGKVILSQDDMTRIAAMLASVHDHPMARLLVKGGHGEVSLRWTDEVTGLRCKARADYYREAPKRYVLDVKTCADASPEAFAKAVHNFGYHLQHAHYADGFRTLGLPLDGFYLLAVETEAPFVCQPYYLDAEAEGKGFALRTKAAATLKRCMESGRFPGYSDDLAPLRLPAWATKITDEETTP